MSCYFLDSSKDGKEKIVISALFLDKSPRFLEPNGTVIFASALIEKDKERRAQRSAAQHDKMRLKQRERSGGRRQNLVSTEKNT
jgi:hypothetical protein